MAPVVASGICRFNFASTNLSAGRLDDVWSGWTCITVPNTYKLEVTGKAVLCSSHPMAPSPARSRFGHVFGYPWDPVARIDLVHWIT